MIRPVHILTPLSLAMLGMNLLLVKNFTDFFTSLPAFSWCVEYAFQTFKTKIYTCWPSEIVDHKKYKYAYLSMYLFMLLVYRTTAEKLSQKLCGLRLKTIKGDFLGIFDFYVLYSTLLHLMPLVFHCADGCWDRSRTQDRCNWCIDSQTL